MNVLAYLRVSNAEQDYNNQLPAVRDFCEAHWWPERETYAENEPPRRAGNQHELSRLLADLRYYSISRLLLRWLAWAYVERLPTYKFGVGTHEYKLTDRGKGWLEAAKRDLPMVVSLKSS